MSAINVHHLGGQHIRKQIDQQHSPDNGMPDSSVQLASQNLAVGGGGNPSTPHTPGTPTPADPGSDTPSHGPNVVNCPSPNYVTINTPNNGDGSTGVNNLSYTSLTPIKSSTGEEDGDEGIGGNGAYVTYVESSTEHPLFSGTTPSTPTGDNVYPVYTVGESGQLYHSPGSSAQYYAASSTHSGITYNQQPPDGGEELYLVTSANNNSNDTANANLDIVGQPVSHATRVSPATVQWLLDNYETAEGVSLPRSTLYYHYMKHCSDHKLDSVNAASFGKLIRSVFLGLRTRRLGTRGNSKYHYYGIRLKPTSPLNNLDDKTIDDLMSGRTHSHRHLPTNGVHHNASTTSRVSAMSPPPQGHSHGHSHSHGQTHSMGSSSKRSRLMRSTENLEFMSNGIPSSDPATIQRFLGDSSHVIGSLPDLDVNTPVPEGLTPHDLTVFHFLYRELCTQLLGDMLNFQFSDFQRRWKIFFRTETSPSHLLEQQHYETILPKLKLHTICSLQNVQDYVRQTDFQLYQNLTVILLPDVLRPIPSAMTQTIRNFAKVVESCLASAMTGYPEELITVKLSVLGAFGQTLRRYTSLNHLAQAARAVLQNEVQINQMLSDLNRVDFSNVEEQASWVCGCNSDIVPDLEADFKGALAQHQSLEEWAAWLESVVDRVLRPHENTSRYTAVARYFLLKWSFYSSLVIRDLTLRSAASFGSFHLLRLLYDEYMFYLIENRVARAINTLPIAVLGKKLLNPLHLDPTSTDDDSESYETMSTHKECQAKSYANSENDIHYRHDQDQSNSPKSNSSVGTSVNDPAITGTLASLPQNTSIESDAAVTFPNDDTSENIGLAASKRDLKKRMKNFLGA